MTIYQRDYLRPKEVQQLLGIGNTKFWNLVKQGYLTVYKPFGDKLVFVKRSEIEHCMNGSATQRL